MVMNVNPSPPRQGKKNIPAVKWRLNKTILCKDVTNEQEDQFQSFQSAHRNPPTPENFTHQQIYS